MNLNDRMKLREAPPYAFLLRVILSARGDVSGKYCSPQDLQDMKNFVEGVGEKKKNASIDSPQGKT
jgi:hypothetical protein